MNRKIIALCILLLGISGAIVWIGYGHWKRAGQEHEVVLHRSIAPKPLAAPLVPGSDDKAAIPSDYFDVAQKTLFSKDRNPVVVIEPPPVKPEPPMPPLPVYHGQMAIGDPVAILSAAGIPQKGYRAGEKIGDFTLLSFDRERITFGWNEKTVERKLADLAAKEAAKVEEAPAQRVAAAPNTMSAPAAAAPASARATTTLGGANSPQSVSSESLNSKSNPQLGEEITDGVRNCVAGDNSPAGTILDGHRKVVIQSMFGAVCRWEPTK